MVKEAWTDRKILLKSALEPQSEAEEAKEEADFAKTIFVECQKFMEALRKYEVAQENKINRFSETRATHLNMIDSLKLDKDAAAISSSFQLLVNSLSTEVAKLEKNLVENRKLAGLITI